MEWITGELRKLADLKAAKAINEEEHDALRKKILEGDLGSGPAAGVEKDLAEHFADEALKKHQAWRHAFEDFKLQEAAWNEEDLPGKQETFLNMAKGGGVSELERMLGFYALYGTNADLKFFQALVATVPDERRIEYHNWYVARAKGEAFLAQHGAAIAAGAPPLFGPMKEYGALNVALLKGAGRDGVYGSGSAGQPCFDKAEGGMGATPLNKTIFAAGYPVPVVDGYVDLGIVEQAVDWLDGRIKELETAMEAAKVAVPPPARAPPKKKAPPQQQQQYHNQGYNNQGYNTGGYHHGGYTQGGRARGGSGRGGRGGRGGGYQGNW